jgi:putative oxidoreductase
LFHPKRVVGAAMVCDRASHAWLIALFLVPVTLMMHKFWTMHDPMMFQIQMVLFMKNVAILGGALLTSQFEAGPLSLDAWHWR